MNDEREWEWAMEAAAAREMPIQVRRVFATIVAYCPVKDKSRESEESLVDKLGCSRSAVREVRKRDVRPRKCIGRDEARAGLISHRIDSEGKQSQ